MRALLLLPALILFLLPLLHGWLSRPSSDDKKADNGKLPRVIITRRVPSVRETIRGKRK